MNIPDSAIATKRTERWWLDRHADKISEGNAVTRDFDIIFVGDSIVHAWETDGELAWNHYFANHTVLNLGFAGDRTEHLLWRLENGEIDKLKTDYVVVLIGTNNAGHRHDTPQDIAIGINAILACIRRKLPACTIILTAIFPRSRNQHKRMRKTVDATNVIIQEYANTNSIVWFDINHHFLDQQAILHESVMPDLLHPNAAQYELWAREIRSFLV